jgi:hypothetical protein
VTQAHLKPTQDVVILAQARIHLELKTTSRWILDHLRCRASRMTDEQDPVILAQARIHLELKTTSKWILITCAAARPE